MFKGTPTIESHRADITAVLDQIRHVNGILEVRDLTVSPLNPQVALAEMQFASTGRHRLSGVTVDEVKRIATTPHDGLQIELSGEFGQQPSFGVSELVGVGAAIVILLITFGSVLAMGLPILSAMFGLGVALAGIAIVTHFVSVPEFGPLLAIMIGLGVGIDYALFIITRYRSGIHHGLEPEAAVVKAVATSGKAVFFAGCTVIISLAGMYIIGIEFVSGLATAAVIAVAFTIATSLTLLPAILGFVGKNIDKLHVPGVSRGEHEADGFWYRWSRLIQRRPLPALVALVVLLVLAIAGVDDPLAESSDNGNRPTTDTTRRAYDLLAEGFGPGFNGPLFWRSTCHRASTEAATGPRCRRGPGHARACSSRCRRRSTSARHRGDEGLPEDLTAGSLTRVADPSPATDVIPSAVRGTGVRFMSGASRPRSTT